MAHPNPDKEFLMKVYRRDLLATKRKFGSSMALVHSRLYYQEYRECKQIVMEQKKNESQQS